MISPNRNHNHGIKRDVADRLQCRFCFTFFDEVIAPRIERGRLQQRNALAQRKRFNGAGLQVHSSARAPIWLC